MTVQEKIRSLRELNNWTQEEMAERMNLSQNGYARIERGESKLNLDKLQKIANIFQIDVTELINTDKGIINFFIENNAHSPTHANGSHCYNSDSNQEIEKLKLTLSHKDEIIQQKDELLKQKDMLLEAQQREIHLLRNQLS